MKIKKNTKYTLGSLLLMMITTLFLTAQHPAPGGYANPTLDIHPDFNNDGYADLAIGVPDEDNEQDNIEDAGAVQVIYGSANGLEAVSANAVINDQVWRRGQAGLDQFAADEDDWFGWALTFGDFNNDGYDDLAIGAPGSIVSGYDKAGAVHVLYGSANGLSVQGQGSQAWSQDSTSIYGAAQEGDLFGRALTAGDFNNDGYDDLVVGVIGEDVSGVQSAGAINVLYGTAIGLSSQSDEYITQATDGFTISAPETADYFGSTLVAADFNNDGIDDLAVGTPEEDSGVGYVDAGIVQILFGISNAGLAQNGTLLNPQTIRADTAGVDNAMEADDRFGYALAAADFNNDSYTDLAIGVPGEDHGSGLALWNAGAVNVVFGASGGLNPAAGAPIFHQDTQGMASYADVQEIFGYSLAVADFNHDGFDDLAISVPRERMLKTLDGTIVHGEDMVIDDMIGLVHILYGSVSGPTTSGSDILYDPYYFIDLDYFGRSITALDTNGDGFIDLAVGVPLDRPPGTSTTNNVPGSVFVFHSNASGVSSTDFQMWYQGYNGLAGNPEYGDEFGGYLP